MGLLRKAGNFAQRAIALTGFLATVYFTTFVVYTVYKRRQKRLEDEHQGHGQGENVSIWSLCHSDSP